MLTCFSYWHGHFFFANTTYLGSLTSKFKWPPNITHFWTCRTFKSLSLSCLFHPYSNMLNHDHFYFRWLNVKTKWYCQSLFNQWKILEVVIMVFGHYCKPVLSLIMLRLINFCYVVSFVKDILESCYGYLLWVNGGFVVFW